MGSEWHDKRDMSRFGSVARGGGNIFRVVILPKLTVWALGGLSDGTVLPMGHSFVFENEYIVYLTILRVVLTINV